MTSSNSRMRIRSINLSLLSINIYSTALSMGDSGCAPRPFRGPGVPLLARYIYHCSERVKHDRKYVSNIEKWTPQTSCQSRDAASAFTVITPVLLS